MQKNNHELNCKPAVDNVLMQDNQSGEIYIRPHRKAFGNIAGFSIILGILFIIFGLALPIPEKHIGTWNTFRGNEWTADKYTEYVGGNAYNIIIEASLRGGIIAGRTTAKAILVVGGSVFIGTGLILLKIKER